MRPFVEGQSFFNLIQTAIPSFTEAEYPVFVQFVTTFLKFLEQHRTFTPKQVFPEYGVVQDSTVQATADVGGPLYEARKLLEYRDADSTLDEFKSHFLSMFGPGFPNYTHIPDELFIKSLRQFYDAKGTVESFQWFFRAVFNEHAELLFPRDAILRASDGTWDAPLVIKVTVPTDGRPNSDVGKFYIGQRIQTASGSAQVESIITNIVGQAFNQNIIINELKLKFDTILGTFVSGQTVINLDSPGQVVPTVILPVIVDVVVNAGGSNYAVGDVVTFSEGPAGGGGYGGPFGLVSIISNTAINGVTVITGGDGFLIGQPVTFISTTGSGASAVVSSIVYGDILLEDGSGFLGLERQAPNETNYLTLEDQNMLLLELNIDPFVNVSANVVIQDVDYGAFSGVAQLDGVGIDSEIDLALAAVDEKPFMDPWVFTNDSETTASLANASATLSYTTNAFFSNGATVFSLNSPTDIVTTSTTANVNATIIVAQTNQGGLGGTLFLNDFTGLNRFQNGVLLKEAGTGVAQVGTLTTDGTSNVSGTSTLFTQVLKPNVHLRFQNGVETVVRAVVNDTFFTTFVAVGSVITANTYSIIPVGTVTAITFQAQRYYGKIKTIRLLTNGRSYQTPPAVVVDSISARAQQLFHMDPDPVFPVSPLSPNNAIVTSASQIHVFVPAALTVQQAAGQIQKVKMIETGVAYTEALSTIAVATHGSPRTGDSADLTAVTGALTQKPGQFATSRGFLSDSMFLQDLTYYNDFTYVIRVGESFDRYKDILLKLLHPAGLQVLGQVVLVLNTMPSALTGTLEIRRPGQLPLNQVIAPYINIEVQDISFLTNDI